MDNSIDIVFLFDILIMFFTQTSDKNGKKIGSFRGIAKNYVTKPRFYFDIFAMIGTRPFVSIWKPFKYF